MSEFKKDAFYMPAEYAPHCATVMIWCERGGSWNYGAKPARPVFASAIKEICTGEKVYLAVSPTGRESAEEYLSKEIARGAVALLDIQTDDCWARDIAPTFVTDGKRLRGIDWKFNAWGGEYNGLYDDYANDDAFAAKLCEKLGVESFSARPFVLEGGSIHSNGKGTVITTEECLLSKGRNPELNKAEIESKLKEYLGAKRVIWLPYGVVGDETDGHVDNICAFADENTVLLGWTDIDGGQKERCKANLLVLENAGIKVIKLPFPEKPVKFSQSDLDGFKYADGEAERSLDEVLAASYVNFYISNAAVIVPQFGDKNDKVALEIIKSAFKDRKTVGILATEIIKGGGNFHCLTQQIPLLRK